MTPACCTPPGAQGWPGSAGQYHRCQVRRRTGSQDESARAALTPDDFVLQRGEPSLRRGLEALAPLRRCASAAPPSRSFPRHRPDPQRSPSTGRFCSRCSRRSCPLCSCLWPRSPTSVRRRCDAWVWLRPLPTPHLPPCTSSCGGRQEHFLAVRLRLPCGHPQRARESRQPCGHHGKGRLPDHRRLARRYVRLAPCRRRPTCAASSDPRTRLAPAGTTLGVSLSPVLGGDTLLTLCAFAALSAVHLASNWVAVQAVSIDTLNVHVRAREKARGAGRFARPPRPRCCWVVAAQDAPSGLTTALPLPRHVRRPARRARPAHVPGLPARAFSRGGGAAGADDAPRVGVLGATAPGRDPAVRCADAHAGAAPVARLRQPRPRVRRRGGRVPDAAGPARRGRGACRWCLGGAAPRVLRARMPAALAPGAGLERGGRTARGARVRGACTSLLGHMPARGDLHARPGVRRRPRSVPTCCRPCPARCATAAGGPTPCSSTTGRCRCRCRTRASARHRRCSDTARPSSWPPAHWARRIARPTTPGS